MKNVMNLRHFPSADVKVKLSVWCTSGKIGNRVEISSLLGLKGPIIRLVLCAPPIIRMFDVCFCSLKNQVELLTGRTHQIRGQLAAEGCPIYGDYMYGPRGVTRLGEVRVERGGSPEEAGTTGETEGILGVGSGASHGGGGLAADKDRKSGMDDNSGAGEVAESIGGEIGGVRERGWEGRFRRTFVDSPCLALQAHEIVLEIGGKVHEWRLSRDTCWWFSGKI